VDGHRFTSPVYAFPPNDYGLRDVVGNVWEWTASLFDTRARTSAPGGCDDVRAVATHGRRAAEHVVKGGSHLCAPGTCGRARPAGRLALPADATTSHLGFRCIVRP
jgi:formylglycine-generating enzyme required for sulfatase activity